jgi:hypothetical protein
MDKLIELFDLCEASVTITHDEHKDYYQTVAAFLEEQERNRGESLDIDPDVRKIMVERNHMITLHAYPHTPIGFYTVYHWDMVEAVDDMLAIVRGVKNGETYPTQCQHCGKEIQLSSRYGWYHGVMGAGWNTSCADDENRAEPKAGSINA